MANNTLNPMPSSNPLDFFDNSENLDLGMNSTAETFFWTASVGRATPTRLSITW